MRIFDEVLSFFYPRRCILCRRPLDREEIDICPTCCSEIPKAPMRTDGLDGIDGWTALWAYDGAVRESILRYKFDKRRSYGKHFGSLLAKKVEEDFGDNFDVIVYVPVSLLRNIKRGYDQVQVLAKPMAKHFGLKLHKVLRKSRRNATQSTLESLEEREKNVQGVYRAIAPHLVSGKRVLLLDDIITTGSTVKECARVLRAAGANKVLCAAIAVTQGRNR